MANGEPGRVEVRVAVESAGDAGAGPDGRRAAALRTVDPVPRVCSRHGEPEAERVRVTISSDSAPAESGTSRIGSALTSVYTVQVAAVDWPVCRRCVATRIRWQIAAAVTCTVFALIFLALVFAVIQGATKTYGIAMLVVFALSFVPMYVALRMIEHRRTAIGVGLADDGSALVVADAHPAFAEAVAAGRS